MKFGKENLVKGASIKTKNSKPHFILLGSEGTYTFRVLYVKWTIHTLSTKICIHPSSKPLGCVR